MSSQFLFLSQHRTIRLVYVFIVIVQGLLVNSQDDAFDETTTLNIFYTDATEQVDTTTKEPPLNQTQKVSDEKTIYCAPQWGQFWLNVYQAIFYMHIIIYALGVITNVLNITVFTRKTMRKNPINLILTALAVVDLLFVVTKITWFVLWTRIDEPIWNPEGSLEMENFHRAIVAYFQSLTHTLTIFYTLLVATWRFFGIWKPFHSRSWFNSRNAIIAIVLCAILDFILRIPVILSLFYKGSPVIGKANEIIALVFSHWGPCIIMIVLTIALISSLTDAKRLRKTLVKSQTPGAKATNQNVEKNEESPTEDRSSPAFDKTTKMLIVILIVFIITESPFGFTYFFSLLVPASKKGTFFEQCFQPAAPIVVLLEVTSCATGFFVYYVMGDKFRSVCNGTVGRPARQLSTTIISSFRTSTSSLS